MDRLFYTSGAATGVPAGADLNSHVRDKVAQAGLVVAIITPTFRTRPYCMAELGAAWSRVGRLFPFVLPGMPRDELDGVLSGLTTPYLDDPAALDQLHDKVTDLAGSTKSSADREQQKSEWLAELRAHMEAATR